MKSPLTHNLLRAFCALVASVLVSTAASRVHAQAQPDNVLPEQLVDVKVDEHLGAYVPRDVYFRDHTGAMVRIGDLFDGRRPVVLNLVYHRCPQLCNLVLNGLLRGLQGTVWTAGDQFDVITLSIDPMDTPKEASAARTQVLESYRREQASRGWHFLVGNEASIKTIASSVGWNYKFLAWQHEFAHPAAIMLLTPDGRVARYLYGIKFEPNDLRFGLLEASEGRSVTTTEKVLMNCFRYDPVKRRYVLWAMRVMQMGAVATIIILGSFLTILWLRDRARTRARRAAVVPNDGASSTKRDADPLGGFSQPVVKR